MDFGHSNLDPRLANLLQKSERLDWLSVKDLRPSDVLIVKTRNSVYTMKVEDPETGFVRLSSNGSTHLRDSPAAVWGTTLSGRGTMIKVLGITVGFRLMLQVEGVGVLTLSPTQEVLVNGKRALPVLRAGVNPSVQDVPDSTTEKKDAVNLAGPLVVRTRNSTYRLDAEDQSGVRMISRDDWPLDFNRCKVVFLELEASMLLDCPDRPHGGWQTTAVVSIEQGRY